MVSESGDYIGGGSSLLWYSGRDSVSVGGWSSVVNVGVSGGGGSYSLTFAAPSGQALKPGVYNGAQRYPFADAGRPSMDISGEGRGCNVISGRFTVLDIAPDLNRLWIVYEQHCEGGLSALFGEVRINEPRDSNLLVAPSRIAWPAAYPGVAVRPVPVNLVNTGATNVAIESVSVVAGGADFSVLGNTCSSIRPGERCTIYVGFTPSIRGTRLGELRITDSTPAGSHNVPLSGSGIAGRTSWDMHSQAGDYIGGGADYHYTPQAGATITGHGNESYASFSVSSGDDWWFADFEASSGHLLLPGTTFTGATRYPFNSTGAGLDVSGNGRGCNELTGKFTVNEATFDGSGALKSFAVDFEQHCEGNSPALTGSIAWRASDPSAPPLDITPPAGVTQLTALVGSRSAHLTWASPADADWVDVVVRGVQGSSPPRTPTSGREIYTGRRTSADIGSLSLGVPYSLAVFTRDTSGNLGPAHSIIVPASRVSVQPAASRITYGQSTRLVGKLTDAQSDAGLSGKELRFYKMGPGATTWALFTHLTTAADGSYSLPVSPRVNTRYEVRFAGSTQRLGSVSAPTRIMVAPRVSLWASSTQGPVGTTFRLSTSVSPNKAGHTVVLQRLVDGAWKRVTSKTLSSTSRATFAVAPRKGTYAYRIYLPGDQTNASALSPTIKLRVG